MDFIARDFKQSKKCRETRNRGKHRTGLAQIAKKQKKSSKVLLLQLLQMPWSSKGELIVESLEKQHYDRHDAGSHGTSRDVTHVVRIVTSQVVRVMPSLSHLLSVGPWPEAPSTSSENICGDSDDKPVDTRAHVL